MLRAALPLPPGSWAQGAGPLQMVPRPPSTAPPEAGSQCSGQPCPSLPRSPAQQGQLGAEQGIPRWEAAGNTTKLGAYGGCGKPAPQLVQERPGSPRALPICSEPLGSAVSSRPTPPGAGLERKHLAPCVTLTAPSHHSRPCPLAPGTQAPTGGWCQGRGRSQSQTHCSWRGRASEVGGGRLEIQSRHAPRLQGL